jgi:ATP-dependent helicase/nuclease subunit A
MSPLNVYKASAGSGKTFALTLEYLKLLFRYPGIHRHILAVTFTNKAAGEMKQRILGLLYKLSRYDGTSKMEEMDQLMKFTGIDEHSISSRAGMLLKVILNDYSGFSVGTIDKFFQSVIRAFTREIGIQPGYNLELDHNRILSLAVDRLFQDLSDQEDLQGWLIRFAEERMEESRSWNFRNDIIQLGNQLFKEAFQGLFLEQDLSVLEKVNLEKYMEDNYRVEEDTRQKMAGIGKTAMGHIQHAGLEIEEFRLKGKSPPSLFQEASEGRNVKFTPARLDSLEQSGKWLNKDATLEMTRLTEEVLMPLLNQLYNHQKVLNTIVAIRKNFYTLGILGDIWERVKSYTRERNLFLISDSSRFLRGIIGGNQVPFIYERTGNRYTHIMLDEFQDTSVFQYDNFRPLIDNALGYGHDNLVVGDVKQAIYRWRNSDWKILASDLESDFKHQEYQVHTLAHNHRSREQIIRFNNTVFQLAPHTLAQTIEEELFSSAVSRIEAEKEVASFREAYRDAVQQIPENLMGTGGMVKMEFFEESDEMPFREQVLSRIPQWIHEIQQSGIEPGEIAILVRSRREGVAVANTLLEHARTTGESHTFRLISNESLLLVHNTSVILILSALRYLVYPGDELNNALIKYQCYLVEALGHKKTDKLFDTSLPLDNFLPKDFCNSTHLLKQLPLYELVESLIMLFGLNKRSQDLPYLQALQDLVIDIHRKEPQGVADFLNYWEQHGSKKGISISEESNAIRILTIHKAKGLEFKAVVVPFCNWEITTDQKKSNILWCETEATPFDRLPMVPVRFSSNMQHTLFSTTYYQERMKGYMDNLNLLYVAFTRARDALFIGIPDPDENTLVNSGDLMRIILDQQPGDEPALSSLEKYRSGQVITIGSLPQYERRSVEEDPWQFTSYPVNQRNRTLKVRMRSDEYFVDEDGIFRTGQMYGNMMHLVFSRISSVNHVDPVLNEMQKEGLVPGRYRADLQAKVLEMISQPGVKRWFSEGENRIIYNERTLFCGDGKVLRPDRVIVEGDLVTVVDFKFGEVEKDSYKAQVKNYMNQLGKLGYSRVEGFVWYVMLGKTIQIKAV